MTDRVHYYPDLIFSVGTQIVTLVDLAGSAGLIRHPRGTVGVVVKSPTDHEHSYRVRFPDGLESMEGTNGSQHMRGVRPLFPSRASAIPD